MPAELQGWLTPAEAMERFGISYTMIRNLVKTGIFTRGQFGPASERPPIFLRLEELQAWKAGGVAAVAPVKAAYEASLREQSLASSHDLGGEG